MLVSPSRPDGRCRVTTRLDALKIAADLVDVERAADYGDARDNFAKVAGLWRDAFGWDVAVTDVPLAIVLLKAARLTSNRRHEDSWIDIAGYAALGCEIAGGDS